MLVKTETRRLLLQAVKDWVNAAGWVSRLFINDVVESQQAEADSLQEATFAGYASVALDGKWHDPQQNLDGLWYIETDTITHTAIAGVQKQVIYGAFISDAGNTTLRIYNRFVQQVTIGQQGDYVSYKWTLRESIAV